jgi:hypothetical protein
VNALRINIAKNGHAAGLAALLAVLLSVSAVTAAAAPDGKIEAKVALYKGRNVFWVNGQPMAPLMYSGTEHSRETWTGRPRQSIEEFSRLGYEIIQTDLWFKYSLRPDGTFDMAGISRQLAGILEVNPETKIIVRINVSAPRWWLEQNPSERCQITAKEVEKVRFNGNSAESLASAKYAEFVRKNLKLFLKELARTPEGNRVMGFHIGGGVYGEWHYYGIDQEPDASEPMRQRFIAFARGRYGTIETANAAWLTSFKTIDEIVVPSYERRYQITDSDFRDPQRDRYVIDYYQCQQATISSLVNGLAKVTKETWPRPAVVGLFFGYFYGGWTVGAQASQFDIETLFRSPYVDYFSGPLASRNMFGSGCFRSLARSAAINGKVWISEHDTPTHLNRGQSGVGGVKWPDVPDDEAQSIAIMRRNFMYTLTENAGQWWYDFGPQNKSGWWGTPAMLAEVKALLDLSKAQLERPYENPSDVLVVYDMASFNSVRPASVDKLTFKITEAMTDSLLGTGAAIDRIFLMDLPKVNLAGYKLVIFGNVFALSDADRSYIKDRVMKDGRSVIFMSGAGYSDGKQNDVKLISDLVGMRVEKAQGLEPSVSVTLNGKRYELDARGVASLFKVDDAASRPISEYKSGEIAAAEKTVRGCRVRYFGVPLKGPLALYKSLLGDVGVRIYVANTAERDYVSIGGGIIAIYSVSGGERTVRPMDAPDRKVILPPFTTRYYDIQTGRDLLAE